MAFGNFGEYMQRKYQIQGEEADAHRDLAEAQANEANQRAATIAPIANASIASTYAGIPVQQSQAGLYGAQSKQINDFLAPIGESAARAIARNFNPGSLGGVTAPGGFAGNPALGGSSYPSARVLNVDQPSASTPTPGPTDTSATMTNGRINTGVTDPTPTITGGGIGTVDTGDDLLNNPRRYAEGTTRVPRPSMPSGPSVPPAPVPGPGDTQTSGQWGPGQNQTLRDRVIRGFAGGTDYVHGIDWMSPTPGFNYNEAIDGEYARGSARVPPGAKGGHRPAPGRHPPPMMPPPSMGTPPGAPSPAQMGPMMPPGPGGPPQGSPGLQALLQAAMGATRVPGQTPPAGTPQDRVHAMLTPGEAVLTPGAAQHMGRDKIAAANAAHPPKPQGRTQMGRGMPKPPGRGGGGNNYHFHIKTG